MPNLIAKLNTVFASIGALFKTHKQLIDGKEAKLPTNGTTGQFLAFDKTWQTPAATVTWFPAADCITAKWSENLIITNLYFAKINGFLAVRGYIMGLGGIQVVPTNVWSVQLKPAWWVYAPRASISSSQTGKKNAYLGSNSPCEFFAKNGTSISETYLCLSEVIYGYGDPIYINDISLGRLINP